MERGGLTTVSLGAEIHLMRELLDRYTDAPMDFADACVVRLAELHPESQVCTVDRHFQFFRKNSREVIPILAPFPA